MAEARKAYSVELKGTVIKHLLVFAASVDDANEKAATGVGGDADIEVVENEFYEDGVLRSRTRRAPYEDRDRA